VWAVGAFDANDAQQILIEHWNGTAWRQLHVPTPGLGLGTLHAVTSVSSTNVWAAGTFDTFDKVRHRDVDHPLFMHWNGTSWSHVPSPTPPSNGTIVMSGVSAASASDIWAVGEVQIQGSAGSSARTLIMHWNGHNWRRVPSHAPGVSGRLSAVSALSATNAWAVGVYSPTTGTARSLIEHWNGTTWAQVTAPNPGGSGDLSGVAAISPNNVWAVGGDGFGQGLTVHWDGSSWQPVGTAIPQNQSELEAVAATPAGYVWTVGEVVAQGGPGGAGAGRAGSPAGRAEQARAAL
jgi:hypothetical protein